MDYKVSWFIKLNNREYEENCIIKGAKNSKDAINIFKAFSNGKSEYHPQCHTFRISANKVLSN